MTPGSSSPAPVDHAQAQEAKSTRAETDGRAVAVLGHLVVAAGNGLRVDGTHGLAVELGRRDAVVAPAELLGRAVDEVAVEDQVDLAVAGKVIGLGADDVHVETGVAVARRLEHVVLVEAEDVDGVVGVEMELLDRVDLVADDVEAVDVLEPEEGVLVDDPEVARLDHQAAHVSVGNRRFA